MEEKGYLKIIRYCLYRERCKSEVLDKLKSTDLPEAKHASIIKKLESDGYLDENRYVEAFVKDKFNLKKWGRKKIDYALKSKKIPSPIIQKAIEKIDDDLYIGTLKHLAEKKDKMLNKNIQGFARKQKIIHYLISKGYEYDLIQDILKNSLPR